jgi:hypothetical protein
MSDDVITVTRTESTFLFQVHFNSRRYLGNPPALPFDIKLGPCSAARFLLTNAPHAGIRGLPKWPPGKIKSFLAPNALMRSCETLIGADQGLEITAEMGPEPDRVLGIA